MSRSAVILIALLGATTTASLVYAFNLHARLTAANIRQLETEQDRADLAAELARLKNRGPVPFDSPASAIVPEVTPSPGDALPENDAARAQVARNQAGRPRFNPAGTPEFRRLNSFERKAALDNRFASLFRKLNLSPADLERLKDLLVDKQATGMDVMNSARAEGLSGRENRDEIRQLVSTLEAETDAAIRGLLGDNGFQQYQEYERTQPQRNLTNQLEQRLSYSSTPLNPTQADQLVGVLATAATSSSNPAASGFGGNRGQPSITDEVISRSQGFLYASQVEALRQLQQEQQTRAQLMQQINSRNNPPPSARPGP